MGWRWGPRRGRRWREEEGRIRAVVVQVEVVEELSEEGVYLFLSLFLSLSVKRHNDAACVCF